VLHSKFVNPETNRACLCESCYAAVCAKKLPELSAANGRDYGNPQLLRWPSLSLVEQALVSRVRLYTNLVKVSPNGLQPGQTFLPRVLRGHCIAFPHDGPVEFCNQLPNLDAGKKSVAVCFVGPAGEADRVFQACLHSSFLRVRPAVVLWCLRALCLLNPEYKDVKVCDSEETLEALRGLPAELAEAGFNADDELEMAVENVLAVDAAEVNYTHTFAGEGDDSAADDGDVTVALDPVLVAPRGGVRFSSREQPKADPSDPEFTLLQAVARTVGVSTKKAEGPEGGKAGSRRV